MYSTNHLTASLARARYAVECGELPLARRLLGQYDMIADQIGSDMADPDITPETLPSARARIELFLGARGTARDRLLDYPVLEAVNASQAADVMGSFRRKARELREKIGAFEGVLGSATDDAIEHAFLCMGDPVACADQEP